MHAARHLVRIRARMPLGRAAEAGEAEGLKIVARRRYALHRIDLFQLKNNRCCQLARTFRRGRHRTNKRSAKQPFILSDMMPEAWVCPRDVSSTRLGYRRARRHLCSSLAGAPSRLSDACGR